MTRQEFLLEMDEILELTPGTLKGPEKLEELEQWNSTAMIGFIALADTNNGARISPRQIINCVTIADLLALASVNGASS
jgi:acyl carrier protein